MGSYLQDCEPRRSFPRSPTLPPCDSVPGPVSNFNKISEIPILFHASDHLCRFELIPQTSRRIVGSGSLESIDTVDEADRSEESASTLGVAGLLRCRFERRKSARRRRKSAKSARRVNGSCQTLIFRFSRLVPRLT